MKLIPKLSYLHIEYHLQVYTHTMKISQMLRSWETKEMTLFM